MQEENLADIYLSAGFGLFFDKNGIGKFIAEGKFQVYEHKYNADFDNEHISLKDSRNIYTVIGIVPAIFMVNKSLLGDRKIPKTWTDLLDESYSNSIAIPMQDLDLFHAVLMAMYTKYGEEAVQKLGKNVFKNMHPAQMIKNSTKNATPLISVAPYFFASMLTEKDHMQAVWPEDGAIVSPIFLLAKKKNFDKAQSFMNFLTSKDIGKVFAQNGKFPSTVCGVDNALSQDKKFIFCGFDFLHNNDVEPLLRKLENIFMQKEATCN